MFIDSGKIVGVLGKEPPVMTKRRTELKARIRKKLISRLAKTPVFGRYKDT